MCTNVVKYTILKLEKIYKFLMVSNWAGFLKFESLSIKSPYTPSELARRKITQNLSSRILCLSRYFLYGLLDLVIRNIDLLIYIIHTDG